MRRLGRWLWSIDNIMTVFFVAVPLTAMIYGLYLTHKTLLILG